MRPRAAKRTSSRRGEATSDATSEGACEALAGANADVGGVEDAPRPVRGGDARPAALLSPRSSARRSVEYAADVSSRSLDGCDALAGGAAPSRRLNPRSPADALREGTKRSEYTVSVFATRGAASESSSEPPRGGPRARPDTSDIPAEARGRNDAPPGKTTLPRGAITFSEASETPPPSLTRGETAPSAEPPHDAPPRGVRDATEPGAEECARANERARSHGRGARATSTGRDARRGSISRVVANRRKRVFVFAFKESA